MYSIEKEINQEMSSIEKEMKLNVGAEIAETDGRTCMGVNCGWIIAHLSHPA